MHHYFGLRNRGGHGGGFANLVPVKHGWIMGFGRLCPASRAVAVGLPLQIAKLAGEGPER